MSESNLPSKGPEAETQKAAPERVVALSHELSELLIELAIAFNRFGMYPPGHPALDQAASDVTDRLAGMLSARATLSFGVARHQLVIEGVATDARHPVLSSLAARLHRHRVGAVTFRRGVTSVEVGELLRALGGEPAEAADGVVTLPAWAAIRLYPLTYDQLELVGDSDAGGSEGGGQEDVRSAQLWIGLARSALASGEGELAEGNAEPAVVAEAINTHPAAPAYDQVIVGYLLQLADELKAGDAAGTAGVRRRLSRLIAELDPETLKRLVEMGGDAAQRKRFTLDVARGFAADAVVEIVRATGQASSRAVSESLLRLLSKLAVQTSLDDAKVARLADHELREQVIELVEGWSLEDPNPSQYASTLAVLSRGVTERAGGWVRFGGAEPLRLVHMALEVDAGGANVEEAVDAAVADGRVVDVVHALSSIDGAGVAVSAVWARLTRPETIHRLLRSNPVDRPALNALVARMGLGAAPMLLDEMMESESRLARFAALDLLSGLGRDVGPLAAERLRDERWYVLRNVLNVLRLIGHVPTEPPVPPLLRHEDARVRREALKLLLGSPAHRDRTLCIGLTDADLRNVRIALNAAIDGYPAAAVSLLIGRIGEKTVTSEMRAQAIRVLRADRSPLVLDALLRLCAPRRTLFGRPRLAPPYPEVVEGIAALATTWSAEPRAAVVIARAARSRDPALRAAAAGYGPAELLAREES